MKAAELVGSAYLISRQGTIPLVLQPAVKKPRKREQVVIPFSVARARPKTTSLRVEVLRSAVWEWVELGLVAVLGSAALFSIILALLAVKNM
jgi:hypothetical protein